MPSALLDRQPLHPSEKPAFLSDLPPFPQVALRAIQLLSNEEVETKAVVQLLSSDTAFTGELLRVANSPLYGAIQEVRTLRHAVILMGHEKLRSLTMTVAMQSYLKAPFRSALFQRSWRHSLATALLSSGLAAMYDASRDETYTAGLLHDAGKFALMVAYPKEYGAIIRPGVADTAQLLRRETRQFGVDHCQSGWWLLQEWGLPREFALAAACHHEEPAPDSDDTTDLVALGCRLATALGFESCKTAETPTVEAVAARLPDTGEGRPELHADLLREAVENKIASIC